MAKRRGRPPKIDQAGREVLREIATAQPHATLDEVTAEFTQRSGLTVNAATVRKALRQGGVRQERGTVVVKRRSAQEEAGKQRYGYMDEHRRQEPDQRYPSCLTQTEWELVEDLFEQSGKRGRPPQYSRWEMVNACCYVVRNGCSWRMLPREFPPWRMCIAPSDAGQRPASSSRCMIGCEINGGAARSARRSRRRRCWMRNRPAVLHRAVRAATMPARR